MILLSQEEEEKVDNIIKLSQTYNFEGEHISEVDLTNLENLNALQMQDIEKLYRKIAKSASSTPGINDRICNGNGFKANGFAIGILSKNKR